MLASPPLETTGPPRAASLTPPGVMEGLPVTLLGRAYTKYPLSATTWVCETSYRTHFKAIRPSVTSPGFTEKPGIVSWLLCWSAPLRKAEEPSKAVIGESGSKMRRAKSRVDSLFSCKKQVAETACGDVGAGEPAGGVGLRICITSFESVT